MKKSYLLAPVALVAAFVAMVAAQTQPAGTGGAGTSQAAATSTQGATSGSQPATGSRPATAAGRGRGATPARTGVLAADS